MLRTAVLAAIALSLAGSASAQQKTDPQLKQQAQTIYSTWEKAVNDYDANAVNTLYTPDAIVIGAFGIETSATNGKSFERNKSMGLSLKGSVKDVQQIDADTALSFGSYQVRFEKPQGSGAEGNWMQVLEKQGSEWKVRAMALARQAPPPATESGSSTSK